MDETDARSWDYFDHDEFALSQWDLYWVTQEGDDIRIPDMNTHHMFFAIRMIFNHSVPAEHATGPHKRYRLHDHAPALRRFILVAMLQELVKRTDLAAWMRDELGHMAHTVDALLHGHYPQLKLKTKVKFDDL